LHEFSCSTSPLIRPFRAAFDEGEAEKHFDQIADICRIAARERDPFPPEPGHPISLIRLLGEPTQDLNSGRHMTVGNDDADALTNLLLNTAASSEAHNWKSVSHGLQNGGGEWVLSGRQEEEIRRRKTRCHVLLWAEEDQTVG
jgi:hypothetical protein